MKFCPVCHSILRLKEVRAPTRRCWFECAKCNTETELDNPRVHQRKLAQGTSTEYLRDVRNFEADPALQRIALPCPTCHRPTTILINSNTHGEKPYTLFQYCKYRGCRVLNRYAPEEYDDDVVINAPDAHA